MTNRSLDTAASLSEPQYYSRIGPTNQLIMIQAPRRQPSHVRQERCWNHLTDRVIIELGSQCPYALGKLKTLTYDMSGAGTISPI